MASRLEAYAELTVGVGVNVERGQDVLIDCRVEHAEFARAVTRAAYAAGARVSTSRRCTPTS